MSNATSRLKLVRRLAAGELAEVWLAHLPQPGAPSSISQLAMVKRLTPTAVAVPGVASAFVAAAQSARKLDHPRIVRVVQIGRADGSPFITLEFVAGEDLRTVWRRHRKQAGRGLPPFVAATIVAGVCEALRFSHAFGMVHGHICPANVLVGYRGEIKVLDFAIRAALCKHEGGVPLDGFRAPEQWRGESIDPRADVFNAGALLWSLIAGRRPFVPDGGRPVTLETVRQTVFERELEAPSVHAPGVSAEIDAIALRSVAKDPDDRFPRIDDLLDALNGYIAAEAMGRNPGAAVESMMATRFDDRIATWKKVFRAVLGEVPRELARLGVSPTPVAGGPIADRIKVELLRGEHVLRSLTVPGAMATVGTSDDAHVRALGDPAVAAEHATLYLEGGAVVIAATGGPLTVNGEHVDHATLRPTDEVQIGRLVFRATPEASRGEFGSSSDSVSSSPRIARLGVWLGDAAVSPPAVDASKPLLSAPPPKTTHAEDYDFDDDEEDPTALVPPPAMERPQTDSLDTLAHLLEPEESSSSSRRRRRRSGGFEPAAPEAPFAEEPPTPAGVPLPRAPRWKPTASVADDHDEDFTVAAPPSDNVFSQLHGDDGDLTDQAAIGDETAKRMVEGDLGRDPNHGDDTAQASMDSIEMRAEDAVLRAPMQVFMAEVGDIDADEGDHTPQLVESVDGGPPVPPSGRVSDLSIVDDTAPTPRAGTAARAPETSRPATTPPETAPSDVTPPGSPRGGFVWIVVAIAAALAAAWVVLGSTPG